MLFTPGPLTTSPAVKTAMLRDLGARDTEFLDIVLDVKKRLLKLADVDKDEYSAILMQGCGSMGVEAVIGGAVPRENGKLLVAVNGAYGRRIAEMARVMRCPVECVDYPEDKAVVPADIDKILAADKAITHVVIVHCETTSGIFNPIKEVGKVCAKRKRGYIVDAMSSFGASEIKMKKWGIHWLISSANKCIEGVPGFSFVIAENKALAASAGNARSLCLDLHAQNEDMKKSGQFRYTPPTHAILAFHRALLEIEAEGGVEARMRRYQDNCRALRRGMAKGVAAKRILLGGGSVCGVETDTGNVTARRVVLAAGIYANTLLGEHGLSIPMAPVRSQYWISEANPALFPRRQPICILPDARAYTRPENGGLIFGWREHDGVCIDPRTLSRDSFGYKFPADPDGWDGLSGCADSLSPYFPGLSDTGIAHYVAGFSGYAPDGLFCVGAFPGVPGLVAAAGCSGMGIAVCGGVGLATSQLALGEEPFADVAPFAPGRLGTIDPFSIEFMRRCSEARTAKKSG